MRKKKKATKAADRRWTARKLEVMRVVKELHRIERRLARLTWRSTP